MKQVFLYSLPDGAVFVHRNQAYRKIRDESAVCLHDTQKTIMESHWGCLITNEQFDQYGLTEEDRKR